MEEWAWKCQFLRQNLNAAHASNRKETTRRKSRYTNCNRKAVNLGSSAGQWSSNPTDLKCKQKLLAKLTSKSMCACPLSIHFPFAQSTNNAWICMLIFGELRGVGFYQNIIKVRSSRVCRMCGHKIIQLFGHSDSQNMATNIPIGKLGICAVFSIRPNMSSRGNPPLAISWPMRRAPNGSAD